jgi:UDP-N-acetylglucosamine acyltransferase
MYSHVTMDVPAYVIAKGSPAEPRGINAEGLKRRGFSAKQIRNIREAYRHLYRQGLKLDEAREAIARLVDEQPELQPLLDSLRDGPRGIVR